MFALMPSTSCLPVEVTALAGPFLRQLTHIARFPRGVQITKRCCDQQLPSHDDMPEQPRSGYSLRYHNNRLALQVS